MLVKILNQWANVYTVMIKQIGKKNAHKFLRTLLSELKATVKAAAVGYLIAELNCGANICLHIWD